MQLPSALRSRGLALVVLTALATSAYAGTIPLVTSGSNGSSGTRSDYWNVYVPATSSITCYAQISTDKGGTAAANVTRSGTTVVGCYVTLSSPGTKSDSYTVTGQPAGVYAVSHGVGGPPNSVNVYMQTTFSW